MRMEVQARKPDGYGHQKDLDADGRGLTKSIFQKKKIIIIIKWWDITMEIRCLALGRK
jgi:hypothetical protein